jgi:hypothetical protein
VSDLHVTAVMDHLTGGGLAVGRGVQPAGTGWTGAPGQTAFVAYSILWLIGSQDLFSATLADTFGEERPLLYIRSFGGNPQQASQQKDAVRHLMIRVPFTVPGRVMQRVIPENGSTENTTQEREVGLHETGDFFRVWTSQEKVVAP